MKITALFAFKSKLLINPCRKLLLFFKFRLKKPFSIRALRFRSHHVKAKEAPLLTKKKKKRIFSLPSLFRSPQHNKKEMNRVKELSRNVSDAMLDRGHFPSLITPGYVKVNRAIKTKAQACEDVEDACRSFENYLVEMIVEEGKVKDLTDVEELLYCWNHLKSPVFIDLVCRFYGELCKDLFATEDDDDDNDSRLQ